MPTVGYLEPSGPIFRAPFSAQAISTNPYDMWFFTAPANSGVMIREIRMDQYSDFGDAQAELISLQWMINSTSTATGTAIVGVNVMKQQTSGPAVLTAGTSVAGPSTAIGSTTSVTVEWAGAWNVAAGFLFLPHPMERLRLKPGGTGMLRMLSPQDALTMNGTITFQEIGRQ